MESMQLAVGNPTFGAPLPPPERTSGKAAVEGAPYHAAGAVYALSSGERKLLLLLPHNLTLLHHSHGPKGTAAAHEAAGGIAAIAFSPQSDHLAALLPACSCAVLWRLQVPLLEQWAGSMLSVGAGGGVEPARIWPVCVIPLALPPQASGLAHGDASQHWQLALVTGVAGGGSLHGSVLLGGRPEATFDVRL